MQIKHHIQAVVVLYKCSISQSQTLNSLSDLKKEIDSLFDLDILIYNNSSLYPIPPHPNYQIYNSPTNNMLAGAYNYALQQAIKKQINWLLLLDQDTTLSLHYFQELHKAISLSLCSNNIASIAPCVTSNKKQISPIQFNPTIGPKWFLKAVHPGTTSKCQFAINSATLINTSAITNIGNFPNEYPLDDLDICYFYRLYKKGYSFITIPTTIQHQLSVLDYSKNMTHGRYQSILFYDKQMAKEIGTIAQIALSLRVFLRIIIQIFSKSKRKYIKQTFYSLIKK